MRRLESLAALTFIAAGIAMVIASFTSVGAARSWDVADAFAADSIRMVRRIGMLLGVLGLVGLVAATPILIARTAGTRGFGWTVTGWIGVSVGTTLFCMAFGLTAIAMPALGELAQTGAVSPQQVADQFVRQTPIFIAFVGGNLTFLAWVPIGLGLARSRAVPAWLG